MDLIDLEEVQVAATGEVQNKTDSKPRQYKCKVQSTDSKLVGFEDSLPIEADENDNIVAPGAKNILFVVSGGNIVGWYFDKSNDSNYAPGEPSVSEADARDTTKFYPTKAAKTVTSDWTSGGSDDESEGGTPDP